MSEDRKSLSGDERKHSVGIIKAIGPLNAVEPQIANFRFIIFI